MATQPKMMWIRPVKIEVGSGRGLELAQIGFERGGVRRVLKPEGELVPTKGGEGHFWKRRLKEGGVERFTPKPSSKTKANPTPKTEAT